MGEPGDNTYDVIVIGSGTCGATVARELSRQKKRVMVLERGGNKPLRENLGGIVSIADEVAVGHKLKTTRAITTGGSTGLYFAVAMPPPLDAFRSLGIDLAQEYAEAKRELPIVELPDELMTPQALRLRDCALALGYAWRKNEMLIDLSKCASGYSFDAKWKARSYVEEALRYGATLINRATVLKVLVEGDRAVGVEYRTKTSGNSRAYAEKIVLAAGSLATPKILIDSGMRDIVGRGFYCDPGFVTFGAIPGLKGRPNFVGCGAADLEDRIALGDANLIPIFYRMMMLSKLKFRQFFSYSSAMAVGVKVEDEMGGTLRKDGSHFKELSAATRMRLKKGEDAAVALLKKAGARHIFNSDLFVGGHVAGVVRIGKDLDDKLETCYANLHVCDGSVLTEDMRMTPVITLVCLGKYLAKQLLPVH